MDFKKAYTHPYRPHSRNVLPSAMSAPVGPFIYFDHLGPFQFPAGQEVYIPPHPHAGIATLSYMFRGEGYHEDSLGHKQILDAGRLNYMNAGKGILHSEGLSPAFSKTGGQLLGVQIWHLLSPNERAASASFQTFSASELPSYSFSETVSGKVLVGEYKGQASPIQTARDMLMLTLESVALSEELNLDLNAGWQYLLYTCEGSIHLDASVLETGEAVYLEKQQNLSFQLGAHTKALLMGGPELNETPLFDGPLVAASHEEMRYYAKRYRSGAFGELGDRS